MNEVVANQLIRLGLNFRLNFELIIKEFHYDLADLNETLPSLAEESVTSAEPLLEGVDEDEESGIENGRTPLLSSDERAKDHAIS